MSKYLKTKEGSIESAVLKSVNTPKEEPKVEFKEYKTSSYFGTKEGSVGDVFNKVMNEKRNYKYDSNFFVNDKTDTLKKMTGRQGYNKSTLTDYLAQKSNKKEDDVYFDDTDLVYKDKTVLKNAETKTVDQMLKALQKEAVDNPYAVGMAAAMKAKNDQPPLKKSTITKAHDIAKSIEKDQKEEVEEQQDRDIPARAKYSKAGGFYYWDRPVKYNSIKKFYYHPKDAKPYPPGRYTKTSDKYEEVKEENEYQKLFKKELEKSGKSIASMSDSEKKDFFNKIDTMYKGKNEELTAAQKKLPPALQKAIKDKEDKKEEVKETHSFHKIKQNKKQTQADGEKEIIDPNPKLKAEDVIRGLWEKAAEDKKEADEKDKEDTSKQALKVKLAKEKDTDTLEKQLVALQGQNNVLKQKLENEKNKAIKPEPNPETGEVPLTVGIAYKHLRDKMKKEEKISEARWEIEGRVSYEGIGNEDSFHMVIDAPNKQAAERKAYDELDKARQRRKIGPGGGGSIEDADIETIERTNDKLSPPETGRLMNSYDPTQKEEKISEARWEIEGRVAYKGVGPEDGFHMVIDAPNQDAAEDKAYDELVKARNKRKIGPGGGGGIDDMEIEYIEKTNDRLQPVTQQPLGNSYDPTQKEEKRPDIVSDDNNKEKKVNGKALTGSPKTPVDIEPKVDYKN